MPDFNPAQTPAACVIFDIDGVIRDVGGSYRRALADTVEQFTEGAYRPTPLDIDQLKSEGIWNNDWEASQELVYRYFERVGKPHTELALDYNTLVSFFQSRYRGQNWDGYIATEPLLLTAAYLDSLTQANLAWGFFSGATRGSAEYILKKRLGLSNPVLIAMEDAPGKPDPTGLFSTLEQLVESIPSTLPILYAGDTVADMYTVQKARSLKPDYQWFAVGILPPHVQTTPERQQAYAETLQAAGADRVYPNIEQLTVAEILRFKP